MPMDHTRYLHLAAISVLVVVSLVAVGCVAGPTVPPGEETVTVSDRDGASVEVTQPVERVISINSGITALIYALDQGEKLVGRDAFSTFPPAVRDVDIVAETSAKIDLERIISKSPDVIMADPMFHDEYEEKLDAAGIPVYVDSTSEFERLLPLIENLGRMLDAEDRAGELAGFVNQRVEVVDERISALEAEDGDKPRIYFEWHSPLKTANGETGFHQPIAQAGGLNIAADQPVRTPEVSAEWIIQQNPEVIVKRVSGDASFEEMEQTHEEMINRPGWDTIDAVKNGRVYIIKSDVFLTFRYPVGLLYYAMWFHPELFQDADPEALHREVIETFFGEDAWEKLNSQETFVYPEGRG
jgi:iron complex transport system substrate-binding protein